MVLESNGYDGTPLLAAGVADQLPAQATVVPARQEVELATTELTVDRSMVSLGKGGGGDSYCKSNRIVGPFFKYTTDNRQQKRLLGCGGLFQGCFEARRSWSNLRCVIQIGMMRDRQGKRKEEE
jgi:hypothetical protein